jgi:hypothetical protein
MEELSSILFLSLSVLYVLISCVKSELSVDECLKLGFNRANLQCSSCDLLRDYELNLLQPSCLQCCQASDQGSSVKQYPKAILEVCGWKLGSFPQVQAFVKSDRPGKFPNLQVKYVGGQMPQIRLLDAEGVTQETLSLTKWTTDTIVEFLQTYLEP